MSAPRPDSGSPASSRLRFVKAEDDLGGATCSVVDDATGREVGRATSENTAAGGTTLECYDFLAGGAIIRFANSRGIYAKDARPGADGTRALPCGDGVFASDVSSCVELGAAPQLLVSTDAKPEPFEVRLCPTAPGATCATLVRVERGGNRLHDAGEVAARWWDARYCSVDRVVVVSEGTIRLVAAPSGKLLAKAAAPGAVRIESCADGQVDAATADPKRALRFSIERDTLVRRR